MLRHLIIVAFVFLLYLKDHNDGSCHPSVYGSLFYPLIGAVLVFELWHILKCKCFANMSNSWASVIIDTRRKKTLHIGLDSICTFISWFLLTLSSHLWWIVSYLLFAYRENSPLAGLTIYLLVRSISITLRLWNTGWKGQLEWWLYCEFCYRVTKIQWSCQHVSHVTRDRHRAVGTHVLIASKDWHLCKIV